MAALSRKESKKVKPQKPKRELVFTAAQTRRVCSLIKSINEKLDKLAPRLQGVRNG